MAALKATTRITTMLSLPPFLIFVAGAGLIFLLPQSWQGWSSFIITIVALLNFLSISQGVYWEVAILDYKLTLGRVDTLGYLFCLLFHIAAVIAALFAVHVRDPIPVSYTHLRAHET